MLETLEGTIWLGMKQLSRAHSVIRGEGVDATH